MDLYIRYVEAYPQEVENETFARIEQLGRVLVNRAETDDPSWPGPKDVDFSEVKPENFRSSLLGPTYPTGVRLLHLEVESSLVKDEIAALLRRNGCAYFMTLAADDGASMGYTWQPPQTVEQFVDLDYFDNPVDPDAIPDLTSLARARWAPKNS